MERSDITDKLAKSLGAKAITLTELANLLKKQCNGATFVGIILDTEPKMRKKDNPYVGRIRKINRVSGMVNFQYDEGVRRRLVKEGKNPDSFVGGQSWHKPVLEGEKLTPLCQHKDNPDQLYLRMAIQNTDKPEFLCDGQPIEESVINQFLPEKEPYTNQGLEKPLRFIAPSLSSIRQISIDGQKYIVK